MSRQLHSEETRRKALELLAAGTPITAVATELGVHRTTLAAWRSKQRPRPEASSPDDAEGIEVQAFVGKLFISGPAELVCSALARIARDNP